MKIESISILETSVLNYKEVENYFTDKNKIFKISENKKIDFELVKDLINQSNTKPNLYGILIKEKGEKEWELKYIGQRKSKFIKDRLRQHLFKKHIKTGAQLDKVKHQLNEGNDVAIKLYSVYPDELRQYYEQKLLQNIKGLSWNKQK